MEGPKLNEYRMGQLAGIGIIRYTDVFGDPHLEEFCHRAQFGDRIGMDGPLGNRCAFAASHATIIIARTSIVAQIGATAQRAKNEAARFTCNAVPR
jgi:hypothetical protein